MKIYTKMGDQGETSLYSGAKVWKNNLRLEVCGALDELNACLGLIRTEKLTSTLDSVLEWIQNDLFNIGSELATEPPATPGCPRIGEAQITRLEEVIDRCQAEMAPLAGFILPGGCRTAALFHLARTICRRAERNLVTLIQKEPEGVSPSILVFINRLSDLFFVLARWSNHTAGVSDVLWRKNLM